jgi:membrane-bound lytic murein transglycosylase F
VGSILIYTGCVKPAASSSFLEKGQKEAEFAGGNQQNSAPINGLFEASQPPRNYTDLVKKYSERYHLDWPLVLAVMKQESRFDREAVSYAGAYGLMQIMPVTQSEIVDKLGVADAATPRNNIRAGVYHLRSMFRSFPRASGLDKVELALAAYNAGLTRIMAAREIARYLGQDPNSWEVVKKTLPLLTHSYYSLHRDIWHEDKPPCGYFGGYRQTVTYVENIMQYYDDYSLALK